MELESVMLSEASQLGKVAGHIFTGYLPCAKHTVLGSENRAVIAYILESLTVQLHGKMVNKYVDVQSVGWVGGKRWEEL